MNYTSRHAQNFYYWNSCCYVAVKLVSTALSRQSIDHSPLPHSHLNSCTSCTTSRQNCGWCPFSFQCLPHRLSGVNCQTESEVREGGVRGWERREKEESFFHSPSSSLTPSSSSSLLLFHYLFPPSLPLHLLLFPSSFLLPLPPPPPPPSSSCSKL